MFIDLNEKTMGKLPRSLFDALTPGAINIALLAELNNES